MLYCYFGHHKAATKYIDEYIMGGVCELLGMKKASIHSPKLVNHDIAGFIRNNGIDFFSYVNAEYEQVKKLGSQHDFKGFHVFRDPRDTLVSGYFSHKESHSTVGWPELVKHRQRLLQLDKEGGLLKEITFSKKLIANGYALHPFHAIATWDYSDPRIINIRYEDLIHNPVKEFERIMRFMGLMKRLDYSFLEKLINNAKKRTIVKSELHKLIDEYSFENISRNSSEKGWKGHYRNGKSGDWANHFTPAVKTRFKQEFPGLVTALGYAPNENW